ncbi:MAG TPA: response regulator [Pyrinomonadaceae bacterium]|jgi:CheY-like chemotaxis protein|nr:response regulator [Pyrinomonadaceae bacterium]
MDENAPSRILFIDDHADTCYMVKEWLGMSNYEVATAQSMASGLQLARSEPFDLYLLDTRLPDGSGRELCEKIREFDLKTPIIFYSGETPEQLRSVLACGAQDYVRKPELEGLRTAVSRAMSAGRA